MKNMSVDEIVKFLFASGSPDLLADFMLLKDASDLYASYGDPDGVQDPVINKKRGKIMADCEFLFTNFEVLGVPRAFTETFVCYGDAFLVKETGKNFTEYKKGL